MTGIPQLPMDVQCQFTKYCGLQKVTETPENYIQWLVSLKEKPIFLVLRFKRLIPVCLLKRTA